MNATDFTALLATGKIEEARQAFLTANKDEQTSVLEGIAATLAQQSLSITPKSIAFLRRNLKAGKTYSDFLKAWTPEGKQFTPENNNSIDYYGTYTQVINAQNVQDETEMISIGMTCLNEQKLFKLAADYEKSDAMRRENISKITENGSAAVYRVLGTYTLGKQREEL